MISFVDEGVDEGRVDVVRRRRELRVGAVLVASLLSSFFPLSSGKLTLFLVVVVTPMVAGRDVETHGSGLASRPVGTACVFAAAERKGSQGFGGGG